MKYYLFQGILGVATKIKDLGQKVLKSSGNQGDNKKTDANGGAVRYSMFSFNLNKNFTILFLVSLNWPKNWAATKRKLKVIFKQTTHL